MAVLLLTLSACATPPRFLAALYDNADQCQTTNRGAGYQQPSYCGAGSGTRYVTRDYRTGNYQTVTQVQR